MIRELFRGEEPRWLKLKPAVEKKWSACLATLAGHSGNVNSVTFSPDGQWLATGSDDSTVKVWDAATGALQSMLEGHSDWVKSVTFSPDGQWLATGSNDGMVKIWDWNAATGALQSTLEGYSGIINSVAFSPDGRRLASGSGDRTVKGWDAITGALQSTLEGHGDWVRSVAFSPDGNYIITDKGTLLLPPSPSGSPLTSFQQPRSIHQLGINDEWITCDGRNLLWLPPDYRTQCSAITAQTIAMGCSSGRVWMSTFLLDHVSL